MQAYKFMREGAISPFTGAPWSVGEWVEGGLGAPTPCRHGVHACRSGDLPYWLNRELWEVELGGEVAETEYKLVAERGRLVRRIDRWNRRAFRRFAEACAARARALGATDIAADCDTVIEHGAYGLAVYFSAIAAERMGGEPGRTAERERQADWLAEHVLAPKRGLFGRRG
jgi:hypothetical protein